MSRVNQIRQVFMPQVYDIERPVREPLKLCLMSKQGSACYCLAVAGFDANVDIETQVANARRAVRKATGALWMLKEIGTYLVFESDGPITDIVADQLSVDRTGLHAVILQGIHIIGADGSEVCNLSNWGGRTFGDADTVRNAISRLINNA